MGMLAGSRLWEESEMGIQRKIDAGILKSSRGCLAIGKPEGFGEGGPCRFGTVWQHMASELPLPCSLGSPKARCSSDAELS